MVDTPLNSISLVPEEPEGTVSLMSAPPVQDDPKIVKSRAELADYALGSHSPGVEELQQSVTLGMEERIKNQASVAEALDNRELYIMQARQVADAAVKQNRELTLAEETQLATPPPMAEDDEVSVEKRVTKKMFAELGIDNPGGVRENFSTIMQVARRTAEDIDKIAKDQSWAGWGADFAKGLVPGYSWAKLPEFEQAPSDGIMSGSYKEEQFRSLMLLPAAEFAKIFPEQVKALAEDNVIEAKQYVQDFLTYSSDSALLDNLFNGLDAVDVATLGTAGIARRALKGGVKSTAAKDMVKELAKPGVERADLEALKGNIEEVAKQKVEERLVKAGLQSADGFAVDNVDELSRVSFSAAKVFDDLDPARNLSNEFQRRLVDEIGDVQSLLTGNSNAVVRSTKEALENVGFPEAKKAFERNYFRAVDGIIEIKNVPEAEYKFGGLDHIDVYLGRKDAKPFTSPQAAEYWAKSQYKLADGSYVIEQRGNNFLLKVQQNVDETSPAMQAARVKGEGEVENSFINTYLKGGLFRSLDDQTSKLTRDNSKVATFGAAETFSRLKDFVSSTPITKGERARLDDVMYKAMNAKRAVQNPDGTTTMVPGVFYHTVGDLERAFMKAGHSLPSENEIEFYFKFRALKDFDWKVKNVSLHTAKSRKGIQQFSIPWKRTVKAEDGSLSFKDETSAFFEGKRVDDLPSFGTDPYTLAVMNKKGTPKVYLSSNLGGGRHKAEMDVLRQQIKDGKMRVIQVADDLPLQGLVDGGGDRIQYIVVPEYKNKPISRLQMPYNEGDHMIYADAGGYVKQSRSHMTKLGRRLVDQDFTVFQQLSAKEGKALAKSIDEARLLYKERRWTDLDAHAASRLPYTGTEVRKFFDDKTWSPDEPFEFVMRGQRVVDVVGRDQLEQRVGKELTDLSVSEHNLTKDIDLQFTQERGERIRSANNIGTEANPQFKMEMAPIMRPMDVMARTVKDVAETRFWNDFKMQSVEDWVSQFHSVADIPLKELRADPIAFLQNPQWVKSGDNAKVASAKNSGKSLIYLLNQHNEFNSNLIYARQKMVDSIIKTKGHDSTLLEPLMWSSSPDPARVARSMVFHMKLGLFNPVQFLLQAQSVIHTAAVDGNLIRAAQANIISWGLRMRGLSGKGHSNMISRNISRALGVNPKQVDEIYDEWAKSGMNVMEGEYGRLDDYLNPGSVFSSGPSKFLDMGTAFFREGNFYHRQVSFITSFLRWRAANPNAPVTNAVRREIVQRADLYGMNMTRASNNATIAGSQLLSVPVQFTNYAMRLADQMVGKRLTVAEKARIVAFYSAAYGVPTGLGVAAMGVPGVGEFWPWQESIKQYMLENGNEEPEAWEQIMRNGIFSYGTSLLGGEGTEYNFGERYGPQGIPILKEVLEGNFFDATAGPSGSSLRDLIRRMSPFISAATAPFRDDDEEYPLTIDDFTDALREISSINNAAKAYYVINAGEFRTRNENVTHKWEDPSVWDAAAVGVLGMSPQEVGDAYLLIKSTKQESEAKNSIRNEALKNYKRGLKAARDGNVNEFNTYMRKAKAILRGAGFSAKEMSTLHKRAVKEELAPMADKVSTDFYKKREKKDAVKNQRMIGDTPTSIEGNN